MEGGCQMLILALKDAKNLYENDYKGWSKIEQKLIT